MRITTFISLTMIALLCTACQDHKENTNQEKIMEERHFTFQLAPNVVREQVHFKNRFGIELTADIYLPKNLKEGEKYPAIAVSGPFGAVKEQCSGLYANELASQGFITMAFDPSFTGESGGEPRYVSSPDINTEDFSAAVDYLVSRPDVDKDKIGVVGICGWGGIALNAAASDPRIHATMAVTMYDMHRVNANGYFDAEDSAEARHAKRVALSEQRNADFQSGEYKRAGGVVDPLPEDAPQFVKDYYAYYKTPRGYAANSLNSNDGWNVTSALSWINTPILAYAGEIETPVLILHGEKAHSLYFGKRAFAMLKGDNKQFLEVPDANHTDLYDGGPEHNKIPWAEINSFFKEYLK